jgi:hypothetical protein
LGIILLFFSSIILWYLECKKYNNKIENRLCGDGVVESVKKDIPEYIPEDTQVDIPEENKVIKS